MLKCKVYIKSKPGLFEQYNGHVDVAVHSVPDAFKAACEKLRNGNFPDRTDDMWTLVRVEVIPNNTPRNERG